MAKKVLVAFASKYGATEQIAEKIALRLRKAGLEAEARDAETLEDISGYSAAVVGSGVYAGQWLKPAAEFLRTRGRAGADAGVAVLGQAAGGGKSG